MKETINKMRSTQLMISKVREVILGFLLLHFQCFKNQKLDIIHGAEIAHGQPIPKQEDEVFTFRHIISSCAFYDPVASYMESKWNDKYCIFDLIKENFRSVSMDS
jgi:hypothetical protein